MSTREATYPALEAQGFDFSVVDRALAKLEELATKIVDLEQHMQAVRDQGIVNATPHWRDGKYLYLIHPQKGGKRKRQYIGANETKQQIALCQVQNFELYHELEQQHQHERSRYAQLASDFRITLGRVARGSRW